MSDIQALIDAWLDGVITDEQVRKLNASLVESAASRRQFARQVQLNLLLQDSYSHDASLANVLLRREQFEERPDPAQEKSKIAAVWARAWNFKSLPTVLVALLLFAMAMLLGFLGGRSTDPDRLTARPDNGLPHRVASQGEKPAADPPASVALGHGPGPARPALPSEAVVQGGPIATVTSAATPLSDKLRVGQSFYASDRIAFADGKLSLRFRLGVGVDLVGPADLELVSPGRAILHLGQLTADVAPSAHGFTIETPHADVIDLGTKFGINVQESGKTDVVVFEGSVDIDYRRRDSQEARDRYERLAAGEAVRIGDASESRRIPVIRASTFLTDWSAKIGEVQTPFISSVSDNLPASGRPIYYSLVPGEFDEDAVSYVDRPYEWNSLPGVPFPERLRGGDYIRLMNDLKFVLNLKIKISLPQPADVYVLFDRRWEPPAWLVRQFTKTNLVIGMDEYDPRGLYYGKTWYETPQTIGVGPGKSIDRAFDIWVRRCPSAGDLLLGGLLDLPREEDSAKAKDATSIASGLSMYGIVMTAPAPDFAAAPTPAPDN